MTPQWRWRWLELSSASLCFADKEKRSYYEGMGREAFRWARGRVSLPVEAPPAGICLCTVCMEWSCGAHDDMCVFLFLCGVIKHCYCESFPESCEASSLEPKDGWRCIVGGQRLLHGARHVNILNPEEKHDTHCDGRQAL